MKLNKVIWYGVVPHSTVKIEEVVKYAFVDSALFDTP